jgi:ribulose-phosphate 3-epimerase
VSWHEWARGPEIEPSIYAANFADLGADLARVMDAGAHVFHFDVGDGHFVEPITMGPIVIRSIAPLVHERGAVLDCHLMVDNPERHIPQIARAGGDSITFHFEATDDPKRTASLARQHGLGVGLAFVPETAVDDAADAARDAGVDFALCMTIHPGYSGQETLPGSYERVARLRELLPEAVLVQVDGGVHLANVRRLREGGAQLLVAGAAVFDAEDPGEAYAELAHAAA